MILTSKQLSKCYECVSELFERTSDANEMLSIIQVKDVIARELEYRRAFEKSFRSKKRTVLKWVEGYWKGGRPGNRIWVRGYYKRILVNK